MAELTGRRRYRQGWSFNGRVIVLQVELREMRTTLTAGVVDTIFISHWRDAIQEDLTVHEAAPDGF